MELLLSFTSPYARKVRVLARERGLSLTETPVDAFANDATLTAHSAVGKVPVLLTAEGAVHDSRVICELLDTLGDAPPLLPAGEALWADRTRASIGDGIMDAALQIVLDARRPTGEQSPSHVGRQRERILRITSALPAGAPDRRTLGDVSVACALHYLDYRLPDLDWRADRETLAIWHDAVEARPAFTATRLGHGAS